ncbi:MAG: tRNA pseudouridine(13) synthase TruD, partial [Thaumarchaeota archaeon]|nr:tRNA pseudouridine(13) synthase TruD [Nitrososphaerota archaeon]
MFEDFSSLKAEDLEGFIGISGYVSGTEGIGGVIKTRPEDFLAWEVLVNGLDARAVYESGGRRVEGFGDYVLAVMRKKGIDTIRAVTALSHELGLKPKSITVCGIKDKVSVSWQFVSIPRERFPSEGVEIRDLIRVLPVESSSKRLSSKALAKNVFEITIRGCRAEKDLIEECLSQLRSRGLPNFYGHQRFGITRPITPVTGRYMLMGLVKEAVESFLTLSTPLESERNRKARERLSSEWDFESALEYFPKSLRYEREMLRYLSRKGQDYVGALRALPLRLRRLLVESVSALIFNKALSKIISEGKLSELEVGDFVVELDRFGRPKPGRPITVMDANFEQVERLIKLGRFAVVLPVVGYLSSIPRSGKGDAVQEALEELELSTRLFRLKTVPEASTRGSLRPITVPKWSCELIRVQESSVTLRIG